jgi:hypothetical protein
MRRGGQPGLRKWVTADMKAFVSSPSFPCFTFNVPAMRKKYDLIAKGWIGHKPCHVPIDTGASMTIARPQIFAGLPNKKTSKQHSAQVTQGDPPCLEGGTGWAYSGAEGISQASSTWTWTSCKLKTQWWIWSTVCYNSAKNRCHYSALEHNLYSPRTLASDKMTAVTAWLEGSLEAAKSLAEPTWKPTCWRPYRTITFIQAWRDVTIRKAEHHQGQNTTNATVVS